MRAKFIAAAAAVLLATGSAQAALVTFNTPINVPNNIDGVYINVLTGATGATGASVPGWDVNPYAASGRLSLFFSNPASAGVAAVTGGPYLDLAPGSVVSAASSFSNVAGSAASAAFQPTGSHILGFRFLNEQTGVQNYGYMTLVSGGPTGFPASVSGWTFENSGGAITVPGAAAVPEPAAWAMLIFGFGAVGGAMRLSIRRSEQKFDAKVKRISEGALA